MSGSMSEQGQLNPDISDSDDDDIPNLVPAKLIRVPITVITGYLGR